jgi:hypothetical protein
MGLFAYFGARQFQGKGAKRLIQQRQAGKLAADTAPTVQPAPILKFACSADGTGCGIAVFRSGRSTPGLTSADTAQKRQYIN